MSNWLRQGFDSTSTFPTSFIAHVPRNRKRRCRRACQASPKLLGRRILRQARGTTQLQIPGSRGAEGGKSFVALLERIAGALEVELLDLFRFVHEETSPKFLRKT